MLKTILKIEALGFPWKTKDPFLFCVHHNDYYPVGNEQMEPALKLLAGRDIGNDFVAKNGWRMYHGDTVPGFPRHPHRGFETVTINKKGVVDHADSMGASGRFEAGDVQWMTAGKGVQHSEMFPLVNSDSANHLEIFQIWLNLPKDKKFVEPHFKMLWNEAISRVANEDENGNISEVDVIAGNFNGIQALDTTPESWAAEPENMVLILTIKMVPNAILSLPGTGHNVNRILYYYQGSRLKIDGTELLPNHMVEVVPTEEITIVNGKDESYLLLLQGKPINEPVVQYGPFVMNTEAEIKEAYREFQQTQFGGWPWKRHDPVHTESNGRFARYSDGRKEIP
jgi:quercetin 2,3-dioxygenase